MTVFSLSNYRNGNVFEAKNEYLTEEAARGLLKFYLTDQLEKTDSGHINKYYQLHTGDYYHINDTMQFEIKCPKCSRTIKVYSLGSDGHTHSWYHCPHCNKEK